MAWPKGKKRGYKTGGRKKGGPQRIVPGPKSPELREMVLRALGKAGGAAYLERIARSKFPGPFIALVGRLLPQQVKAEVDVAPTLIQVVTGFDEGPPET
jgi:hypothetical protein